MTCSDVYSPLWKQHGKLHKSFNFKDPCFFVKLIALLEKRNVRIFEMECHLDNFFPPIVGKLLLPK